MATPNLKKNLNKTVIRKYPNIINKFFKSLVLKAKNKDKREAQNNKFDGMKDFMMNILKYFDLLDYAI